MLIDEVRNTIHERCKHTLRHCDPCALTLAIGERTLQARASASSIPNGAKVVVTFPPQDDAVFV